MATTIINSTDSNPERLYYTVNDIHKMQIIPLGKNKLYDLTHRADFPKVKFGRKTLIPVEGLHEWVRTTWRDVASLYQ